VPVRIRSARPADAAGIARLLGQLGYPAEEAAVTRRLERLGDDRLFVADTDGQVAGIAQLHVSPSLEYDRPTAKLAVLVVDGEHRNGGIGRALVDTAESDARARDCELLFLTTAERRVDAHAFYARLGFEHSGRRYAKRFA
jgi:aminoglycoside 6'-N-acetyltransferase I